MGNELAEDIVFNATEENLLGGKELLVATEETKQCLLDTSKWVKILAIFSCIALGFCVIFAITILMGKAVFSNALPKDDEVASLAFGTTGFIYIIIAALFSYPIVKMFKYVKFIRAAIQENDDDMLANGFNEMRRVFKFFGWIILGYLLLIAFAIIIAIIIALFESF